MYVGKAPTVKEPTNVKVVRQPVYRPVDIQPDLSVAKSMDMLANSLEKINEANTQLQDYNKQTELYTQLNVLSKQAEINKWTPEQYKQKVDEIVNKYEFTDPDIRTQTERYINLHYATTAARLQALQLQDNMNKALASTMDLGDKMLNNITDEDSYMNAITTMQSNLDLLVKKGFLNPVKAQEYIQEYKKQAKSNLLSVLSNQNPEQFLRDLKSGKYNDVFNNQAEKQKLIKALKIQMLQQKELQLRQQRLEYAQMTHDLFNKVANNEMSIVDLMKDPNIPAEVKSSVASKVNQLYSNNPETIKQFNQIALNISAGKYNSIDELEDDLNKARLTTSQYRQLYALYDKVELSKHESTEINEQTVLSHPIVKNTFNTYLKGALKTAINTVNAHISSTLQANVNIPGQQRLPTQSIDFNQLYGAVRNAFIVNLDKCMQQGNVQTCIANAQKIADKSVYQVVLPLQKEDYYQVNDKYFSYIYLKKKGFMAGEIQLPHSFYKVIADYIFNKLNDPNINPQHFLDLSDVPALNHGQGLQIGIKVKDKDGKLHMLIGNIYVHNNSLVVLPQNEKEWLKVVGE